MKQFDELKARMLDEISIHFRKNEVNLENEYEFEDAVERFYSHEIVDYMKKTGLELSFSVGLEDGKIKIDIWELK